jgi:signal transduction histidine kinase
MARIEVRDHGLGINPDDLPRLFTRFGRLVTSENSHIPGTGLGLYLARELARMQGGDITARSTVGKGSVFTFALPLAEVRSAASA